MNTYRHFVHFVAAAALSFWTLGGAALFPRPALAKPAAPPPQKAAPALVAAGKIKAITKAPRPGAGPYKDAVIAVHLTGARAVRGKLPGKELLVYVWGLRDNKLAPAASFKPGQAVTLSLQPWETAEDRYGGYNRRDFEDDALFDLPTYWGEPAPR